MKAYTFALLIVSISQICSSNEPENSDESPDIGKTRWDKGYHVAIQIKTQGGYRNLCGGAILSIRMIITAASCLRDYEAEDLRIIIGQREVSIFDEAAYSVGISKIFLHPKSQRDEHVNDIAIIKTDKSYKKVSKNARKLSMPDVDEHLKHTWYQITGFSSLDIDGAHDATLESSWVMKIDHDNCRQNYGKYDSRYMFCVQAKKNYQIGKCITDAGAPLIGIREDGEQVLIGLILDMRTHFFGHGCFVFNEPAAVLTLTSNPILNWINNKLSKTPDPGKKDKTVRKTENMTSTIR